MGNQVQTRFNVNFMRADRPAGVINSTSIGGAPITMSVGTPQVLPVSQNLPSDRVIAIPHLAGPTSARPTTNDFDVSGTLTSLVYFDTTLSQVVVHDGANWRNVFSGAIV